MKEGLYYPLKAGPLRGLLLACAGGAQGLNYYFEGPVLPNKILRCVFIAVAIVIVCRAKLLLRFRCGKV